MGVTVPIGQIQMFPLLKIQGSLLQDKQKILAVHLWLLTVWWLLWQSYSLGANMPLYSEQLITSIGSEP